MIALVTQKLDFLWPSRKTRDNVIKILNGETIRMNFFNGFFFMSLSKLPSLTLVRIRMLEINRCIGHANVAGDVAAMGYINMIFLLLDQ